MRSASKFLQLLRDAKASGVLVEEVTWAGWDGSQVGLSPGHRPADAAAETLDLDSLIEVVPIGGTLVGGLGWCH